MKRIGAEIAAAEQRRPRRNGDALIGPVHDAAGRIGAKADAAVLGVLGERHVEDAFACVEPVYRDVDWDDGRIVEFARREHLPRRNLTPSERAAAADRQKNDPFGSRVPDHSVVHRVAIRISR